MRVGAGGAVSPAVEVLFWAEAPSCHLHGTVGGAGTHPARPLQPNGEYRVFLLQICDAFLYRSG